MRENEGLAARILLDFDADDEKVRAAVRRAIADPAYQPFADPARLAPLDWRGAHLMWRPEGLELRIPLRLGEGEMAAFAADAAWSAEPLARLAGEIWRGWLALASPTLLDDVDPDELRGALDAAAQRAREETHPAAEFLLRLRRDR
jgi:hypothetical protein